MLHKIDEIVEQDRCLIDEEDETKWLGIDVSKCNRYFIMSKVSKAGNEVNYLDPVFHLFEGSFQNKIPPFE